MQEFKYSYPALVNLVFSVIAVSVILSLFPDFSLKKPQYKKM